MIAAAGRTVIGSTCPAGAVPVGGEAAGRAGSMVGGARSMGFDEHPPMTAITSSNPVVSPPTVRRRACCGNKAPGVSVAQIKRDRVGSGTSGIGPKTDSRRLTGRATGRFAPTGA